MTSIEERTRGAATKLYTLIIVKDDNRSRILLGFKKRGFAVGTWNGFGGKVEEGETIEEAANRELLEECGLEAVTLQKLGVLYFKNASWNPQLHVVHLFVVDDYNGDVIESEEMLPRWFSPQELPYEKMLASNIIWMPKALRREQFDALFIVQDDGNELLDFEVEDH